MTDRLWILGASDPEMAAIEALLHQCGEQVAYALDERGERVRGGNAYGGWAMPSAWGRAVYLVECDPRRTGHLRRGPDREPFIPAAHDNEDERPILKMLIDHHRPGDPGYGRPPAEFLLASSIGQVISELARLGRLPWASTRRRCGTPARSSRIRWLNAGQGERNRSGWVVDVPERSGPPEQAIDIPDDLVLTAAADHCLAAVYRGECSGADPDELMRWRVGTRAAHQGRSAEEILADVDRARAALLTAPEVAIGECPTTVRDMRGRHVPELPEAAARAGVPFLASMRDHDGRTKVVLQVATPEVLAAWPAWAAREGIVDLYGGDPARGFAGGYLATT